MDHPRPQESSRVPPKPGHLWWWMQRHLMVTCSRPHPMQVLSAWSWWNQKPSNNNSKAIPCPLKSRETPDRFHLSVDVRFCCPTQVHREPLGILGRSKMHLTRTLVPTTGGAITVCLTALQIPGKHNRLNARLQITERWHVNGFLPCLLLLIVNKNILNRCSFRTVRGAGILPAPTNYPNDGRLRLPRRAARVCNPCTCDAFPHAVSRVADWTDNK